MESAIDDTATIIKKQDAEIATLRAERDLALRQRDHHIGILDKFEREAENAARQDAVQKERLTEALKPFANIALEHDCNHSGVDCISGPDLAITPRHVREARAALACRPQGRSET